MKHHSSLLSFTEKANAKIDADYHAGFFSLRDDLKDLVYGSDVLAELAGRELRRIAEDFEYSSPAWEPHYLVVANGKHWQLRVGVYQHSPEFIYTLPMHMMVAVLGEEPLKATYYRMPTSLRIDTFDPNARLDDRDWRVHVPGDIAVIDGRNDLFDVDIDSPVLVVKFTSSFHQSLQWAFDRKTGSAVQPIAANSIDSELVSMVQALGSMGSPIAVPSLIGLCEHSRHFVRWAAMQALGRVSPEELLPQLHNAATNDPHPHVQAAAKHALARISERDQSHAHYH